MTTLYGLPIEYIVIGILLVLVMVFMMRMRELIATENRIADRHFGSVKDYIYRCLETIESDVLRTSRILIKKQYQKHINNPEDTYTCGEDKKPCDNSTKIWELEGKVETSEFARIISGFFDNRARYNITNWMRENGFHDDPKEKIEEYKDLRTNDFIDMGESYFEKRLEGTAPSLMTDEEENQNIKKMFNRRKIRLTISNIVDFAIEKDKETQKEIDKFRNHNNPLMIFKKVIKE